MRKRLTARGKDRCTDNYGGVEEAVPEHNS